MTNATRQNNTHARSSLLEATSHYPLFMSLYALSERMTVAQIAEVFSLDGSLIRAHASFARDVLISRAREAALVDQNWSPTSTTYGAMLHELSRAITSPWRTLLTDRERDELSHTRFVIRIARKRFPSTYSK